MKGKYTRADIADFEIVGFWDFF